MLVARAFYNVLIQDGYRDYFEEIIFAVLVTPGEHGNKNYKEFKKVFSEK